MNTRSNLPLSAILKEAKQLAALVSIVGDEFGDNTFDSRETELIGLADTLAAGIYDHFRHSPTSGTAGAAYGASGRLAAVLTSIVHAYACAALAADESERDDLANRVGWMQLTAREIADELAGHVEQLCAEGGAA